MATKTKKKARTWVCTECKEPKSEADVSSSCGEHGGVRCEGCAKNHEREVHAAPAAAARFRDRIKELRRVRAGDLLADPRNWRVHGERQTAGLTAVLEEVGYADALIARETPAGLMLIDGHLRKGLDPEQPVPVLVLDVNEEEAGKILATLDPLAAMAEADGKQFADLLSSLEAATSESFRGLLDFLREQIPLPEAPPTEFPPKDDDLATDHRCPKCAYEWSGKCR